MQSIRDQARRDGVEAQTKASGVRPGEDGELPTKGAPMDAQPDEALYRAFFDAVLRQDRTTLRGFFREDAAVDWPCTNERFTLEEYIRANCEYPGAWDGELLSILPAAGRTVLIARVWPKDKSASFHCVSVIEQWQDKIASLTEYWSDDGPAPRWRRDMGIGKPIYDDAALADKGSGLGRMEGLDDTDGPL